MFRVANCCKKIFIIINFPLEISSKSTTKNALDIIL